MLMPSSARAGRTLSSKMRVCMWVRSCAMRAICSRTSRGSSPEGLRTAMPVAMRRLSPATRTMKNSSRLLVKIARKRARSSRGTLSSAASCRTRSLNCSQLISRSRNRSTGRSVAGAASSGRLRTKRPLAARGRSSGVASGAEEVIETSLVGAAPGRRAGTDGRGAGEEASDMALILAPRGEPRVNTSRGGPCGRSLPARRSPGPACCRPRRRARPRARPGGPGAPGRGR